MTVEVGDEFLATARERIAARRASLDALPSSLALLDAHALRRAHDRARMQPRCDLTVNQLPVLGNVPPTALVPIWNNGKTYAALVSVLTGITQSSPFFNVKVYGALGNGVADDTAAIRLAISAANEAGGGIVFFPAGSYIISSTLTLGTGVSVIGAGWGLSAGAILRPNFQGDLFQSVYPASPVSGLYFSNFTVSPTVTPTSGAVFNMSAASDVRIDAINVITCYDFLIVGTVSVNVCNQIFVNNCTIGGQNGPCINRCIFMQGICGNVNVSDCIFTGQASTTHAIVFGAGCNNSPFSFRNLDFEAMAYGITCVSDVALMANGIFYNIIIDAAALGPAFNFSPQNTTFAKINQIQVTDCWFTIGGANAGPCVLLSANSSGGIFAVQFSNSHFESANGAKTVVIERGASDISFSGCQLNTNGPGYLFNADTSGQTTRNITITGGVIGLTNQGNPTEGIYMSVAAGAILDRIAISGVVINNATTGVRVVNNGTLANMTIVGNALASCATPLSLGGANTTEQPFIIANNGGYNPIGVIAQSVPASGATVENNTGSELRYIIEGGTISAITLRDKAGNSVNPGVTSGMFVVGSGESIALTYSVAPTTFAVMGL